MAYIKSLVPIDKVKAYPLIQFDNIRNDYEGRYRFNLDGSYIITDPHGNTLIHGALNIKKAATVELYRDDAADKVGIKYFSGAYYVWIHLDFAKHPKNVKITIEGHLDKPTDIEWPLSIGGPLPDKSKEKEVTATKYSAKLGDYKDAVNKIPGQFQANISFDWADDKDHYISLVGDILHLNVPADFKIDPENVLTSTSVTVLGEHWHDCAFYANGRWWLFYQTAANMSYTSKVPGGAWAAVINIRASGAHWYWDVAHQQGSNFIHYTYNAAAIGNPVYYRRGLLNNDGSITWTSAEVNAHGPPAGSYYAPTITVDAAGYSTIITYRAAAGGMECHPNANNDGTWLDDAGSPKFLGAGDFGKAQALNGGSDLVALWWRTAANNVVSAMKYTKATTTWGAARVTVARSNQYWGQNSINIPGTTNVLHTFFENATNNGSYAIFSFAADAWTVEGYTSGPVAVESARLSCDLVTGKIFAFTWGAGPVIQVKSYSPWGLWTAITGAEAVAYAGPVVLRVAQSVAGVNKIGVFWATGAASPYQIRFQDYDVPALATPVTRTAVGSKLIAAGLI